MRMRSVVTFALAAAVLVACGEPGSQSQSWEPAGPSSSLPGVNDPSTSTAPAVTAEADDDAGSTADVLERCADVAQITTDVVNNNNAQSVTDPVFRGVVATYAEEHADTFGGMWTDRVAKGTFVLAFTDGPAAHLAALAERSPSPDDVHVEEPPPEITDDRPIGEWDVAFDVVQVEHTEAELVAAIGPVVAAVRTVIGAPATGGEDPLRNRVSVDLPTPIRPSDLGAITEAIEQLDGIYSEMVCWSGQFIDEAPDPIESGTSLDVIRLPDDNGTYPADTPVTCDGLQFALGDLDSLTPAADVEPGLKSVLDSWLANDEGQFWPQEDWSLLHENDDHASFIHVGDDGVSFIGAEMAANGWIWAGASAGGRCDVELRLPDGLGSVEWVLNPQSPAPAATSTEIGVSVTERDCASGQAMGDRLIGPQIVESDDAVRIAFAVISQSGDQNCPDNPSEVVIVELETPLGEREIRNGLTIGPITSLLDN